MIESESVVRAFLHVIYHVALFVRARSSDPNRLSDDHLFGLMDAVHNVPGLLTNPNGYFTVEKLRDIRSYVVVGAFVIGAIFTPPDVMSQLMLAIPLCLLYEAGIVVASWGRKNKTKEA